MTAPLVAFAGFSFKAASDANELQSAFNVTFGAMAADMTQKPLKATGDAMGRSTQTMEEAANTFGIFFNTAVPPAKAAEMAKTFAAVGAVAVSSTSNPLTNRSCIGIKAAHYRAGGPVGVS